jgi:allophanate hydrolase subunit 2
VTADCNRVGVRLSGPPLSRKINAELPSEGLLRGAIQVPPSGQPLIFLADHPVTGGYPVIAVLAERARDHAAQLKPGDKLRFELAGRA